MAIQPTKETLACVRVLNENFDRSDYMRLDKNENTTGFSPAFVEGMLATMRPELLSMYPQPWRLRKRLAEFTGLSENRLLLTSGVDAGIRNCFEAFVEKGDAYVRMHPTYAMADVYGKLFGTREILVEYDRALQFNVDDMKKALARRPKMAYIANPNSPTGTVMELPVMEEIIAEAAKNDVVLILDETYHYFTPVTAVPLLDKYENLIILRSFSKAVSLAAVRLGYAMAAPKVIDWMARWRFMYEINGAAELFGMYLLDHWGEVERFSAGVVETREWFRGELHKRGLETFESHANFVLAKYPKEKIPAMVKLFMDERILIKGGGGDYPLSETLRFSIGTREQMARCLELLDRHRA